MKIMIRSTSGQNLPNMSRAYVLTLEDGTTRNVPEQFLLDEYGIQKGSWASGYEWDTEWDNVFLC